MALNPKLQRAVLVSTLALLVVALPVFAQKIPNPIPANSLKDVLITIVRVLLGLLGIIGTFMFIWGGYQLLLSGGNAETIKHGKATMFWAAIGLTVILGSWVLIQFILNSATKSTTGT
jgi:hypothetical protein